MADHANDNYFQVSIKGLFFNEENKVMLIQEKNGLWDLPGGRIQKGEDLIGTLKRECLEETGIECEVLDNRPLAVYSSLDEKGKPRAIVCYKIKLESLDFKTTEECVDIKFLSKEEIRTWPVFAHIKKLPDFL